MGVFVLFCFGFCCFVLVWFGFFARTEVAMPSEMEWTDMSAGMKSRCFKENEKDKNFCGTEG